MKSFLYLRTTRLILYCFAFALILTDQVPAHQSRTGPPTPQENEVKAEAATFTLVRAGSQIRVDGVLDEQAWNDAPIIPLLYEWSPGDNIPAPVKTECLVTYDVNNLYLGFRCYDPEPGRIRAHLMDRDDTDRLILDDHISFMIDSFNDERRGFQFRANPLGVQADANFSESEGYEDFSWDAIWNAAGKITDWGWVVEIAIPLNQLRFKKTDGPQTWGFSAERSWPREARHRITSHVRSRNIGCLICQFNKLTGFEGITPSRNIEFNPTLTGSRTDTMDMSAYPEGGLLAGDLKAAPGLTAKWGVTPNIILNAALNPDFSQVEADVAQLNINRRFALFYPEKRPFFLEGGDFFLTPIQAVFTRTVADPLWGLKLTGKVGKTAVGFFAAQDEMTNFVFPSNQGSWQGSLDQDAFSGVLRLRQDVGRMSTVGLLYTGRTGQGYHNHLGGIDGFFRFDQKNSFSFQFLHSQTGYPEAVAREYHQETGSFGGNALSATFQHFSRNWIIMASYQDLSGGFRADSGFIPRVDIREGSATVFRQIWGKPGGWFNMIRLGASGLMTYDHAGNLTDQGLVLGVMYNGRMESVVNTHGFFERVFFAGRYFDTLSGNMAIRIRPFSGSEFSIRGMAGETVDYENARTASVFALGPQASLNLGRHLNVSASHNYEHLFRDGETIYSAHLSQARLIYNFNVRAFIRAIFQYRDIEKKPDMYNFPVDPKNRGVFTQLLFSYKLNPRTMLFLGYSDNALGGEFENPLGRNIVDLTRINRTFFMKIGYAWQI